MTDTLPALRDRSFYDTCSDSLYRTHERCESALASFWRMHARCFVLSLVVVVVGIIVVVVLATQKTTTYPCLLYSADTLATEVSVACLQYLWNLACPTIPYTFPDSYVGWWRSSPQGTVMVPCHITTPCGAGSYQHIALQMQLCQPNGT